MDLHIGTYDGNIITFRGMLNQFTVLNSFQASQNSIRTLHRIDKYLFAGGFDQIIHIYDMSKNRQLGQIQSNQGTINHIISHGQILITTGSDGTIKLWKMKSWEFLHLLKQHKNNLQSIALHPSGKMMFSVGKDKKLIIWNLLKAMRVFDKRLEYQVNKILIYQQCKNLILLSYNQINILQTETNKEVRKIKIQSQKFQDGIVYKSYLFVSTQRGIIYVWNLQDQSSQLKFNCSQGRVKVLTQVQIGDYPILISGSSNGEVKFWDILSIIGEFKNKGQKDIKQFQPLDQINIKQRIITITCVVNLKKQQKAKIKQVVQEQVVQEQQEQQQVVQEVVKVAKKKKINKRQERLAQIRRIKNNKKIKSK